MLPAAHRGEPDRRPLPWAAGHQRHDDGSLRECAGLGRPGTVRLRREGGTGEVASSTEGEAEGSRDKGSDDRETKKGATRGSARTNDPRSKDRVMRVT